MSSACALVALSAPVFAQPKPAGKLPAADCVKTETQAECHARLKCRPNEELEECKKRRDRAIKAGRDPDKEDPAAEKAEREKAEREGADKKKPGEKPGEKPDRDDDDDDDDKKAQERRDRERDRDDDDDDRKKPRQRDRDDDDDDDDAARARRQRERDNDDDDDDDDDDRGGGGGDRGGGVLRPGTRPGFFSGGIGPSFGFCYRGCRPGDLDYQTFYGTLDFGWHFSGDFEGPAIGANLHGGYGSFGRFDHGRLGVGFKFWWDIQMADDLGLYLTPFAQAGFTSFSYDDRRFVRDTDWEHFFNFQFGMQLRMILGNRGLVYVQPVTFDNVFNGDGYGLLYHFEIGGGVIFGG